MTAQTTSTRLRRIRNLREADYAAFDAEITNQFIKRGWLTKGNN